MKRENLSKEDIGFSLNGDPDDPTTLLTEPVRREDGRLVRAAFFTGNSILFKAGSRNYGFTRDFVEYTGQGSFGNGVLYLTRLLFDQNGESFISEVSTQLDSYRQWYLGNLKS